MAIELDGKVEQPDQTFLLEADYLLDREAGGTALAIRLVDEAVSVLALPQEALDKIHRMIQAALEHNDGDRDAGGGIRLHIATADSFKANPSKKWKMRTAENDEHPTWGMFLVQHHETDLAGGTRQLIELRLYREIG